MIPATISTMVSTTSPVTATPKINGDNRKPPIGGSASTWPATAAGHHRQHLASTRYPELGDDLAPVIVGETQRRRAGDLWRGRAAGRTRRSSYTLIRSGPLIQLQAATHNAIGDHEPTRDLEICRDHRVCRTRRWREMDSRCLFRDALTRRQRGLSSAACFGGE